MHQHTFNKTVGVIFLIVGLAHLARIFYGWKAVVNGWTVPVALSWVAVVVAAYLSYHAYQLGKRS